MSSWDAIYSNSSAAGAWTKKFREHNVKIIYDYFTKRGWNIAPLAAMLGNMEYESFLNPGQWETAFPVESSGGFGLVQWTPYTKFSNWAGSDWRTNYDLQLDRIQFELTNNLQWIPTATYNFSFADFSKKKISELTIAELTKAFEYCYERGTWNNQRIVNAEYWYKVLKRWQTQRLIIYFGRNKKQVKGVYII